MKRSIIEETLLPGPEPTAAPINLRSPLDRAHFEAAEEIDFARPKFLRVEHIKAGITEIATGLLLFVGIATLIGLFFVAGILGSAF
jgi:hypothetical protein